VVGEKATTLISSGQEGLKTLPYHVFLELLNFPSEQFFIIMTNAQSASRPRAVKNQSKHQATQ
jgi:hypothetical protein